MSAAATLLVELLTEELPPKALRSLGDAFAAALAEGLRARDFLLPESATTGYATPRRLAVSITQVRAVAPDKPFKERLLPVSVAYDAVGRPTAALRGKLKAKELSDCDLESLLREHDGKMEVLWYVGVAPGGPLFTALQAALAAAVAGLPMPKVMSYARPGSYYNDERFVRPAHGLVALHGTEIVPVSVLGLAAGRQTAGHRFARRPDIDIAHADAYAPTLEAEGKVLPGFAARRGRIVTALETAASGAAILMPDALLDEVSALVEWPKVYTGGFDAAFLEVPQECLILTMQQNQKYFALRERDGSLQNRFLLVSNLDPHDPQAIIGGNERVLHARLADARFFYDQDRKVPLVSRVLALDGVVYHRQLGSQGQRVSRLRVLAQQIAVAIGAAPALADRAALLAKADLVTAMVGEFPELQGTMGRYYALHDGEPAAVADALAEHYRPRFAGDELPAGPVARAVALADKLEALAGHFGVGEAPTGEKDPFGLRRSAIGVLRILIEGKLAVDLHQLIEFAFGTFAGAAAVRSGVAEVEAFIHDRLRAYLRERGYTATQVDAVMSPPPRRIDLVPERLAAVQAFVALPEAGALASANKRIVNILKKSGSEAAVAIDRSLFSDGAEHDLFAALQHLQPVVHDHVNRGQYTEALRALASARASVDRFFDQVLVMAEDPALRANRLALLRGLAAAMNQVADISKLAV
jgi:glycyl-tRNA synthetase beta chain